MKRLLIDSDAFCKLGVGGILVDACSIFETSIGDCGRLPALPHMLRKGSLVRRYGEKQCAKLLPLAMKMGEIGANQPIWLDELASIPGVDPGEALLLASAAQDSLVVVTGDKRALRNLKAVPTIIGPLAGRVVIIEAILLALLDQIALSELRKRIGPLLAVDTALQVCFSAGNTNPRIALQSYFDHFEIDVQPLVLWQPSPGR